MTNQEFKEGDDCPDCEKAWDKVSLFIEKYRVAKGEKRQLEKQLGIALEALGFYGEEMNWEPTSEFTHKYPKYDINSNMKKDLSLPRGNKPNNLWRVGGRRARAALKQIQEADKEF